MNLKKKALSGAAWKLAERLLAQGISMVVTIVLARLLLPADYGVVSMVTIFFTFANVLISGGLNTALIQKSDADSEDYSTVFTVSLLVGAALYGLMFVSAPVIAGLYGQPMLVPVIRIMGLSLPVYAIKSIACAYTSATLQFRKFFFATLGGTLISGVVGIAMAYSGCGPWALVAQQMTNTVIDTVILFAVTKLRLRLHISMVRLRSLYAYGWKILVSSLLGTIYNQINPLVIGIRFSLSDLSFYTKGFSLVDMIASSLTYTLSSVLLPVLAKVQDDLEQLRSGTRTFMRGVSFLVFPMMLGLYAVSDNFVTVLLTEKWLPAAYYIRIFCVSHLFDIVAAGNCETIKAMGRSDVFLKIEVLKKSLYFVTLFLFIAFTNSPEVMALSNLVIALIAVTVNLIPNIRLIGYTVKMQLEDIWLNLAVSILMCVGVCLVGRLSLPALPLLMLQIVSGVGLYLGLNLLVRNPNLSFFTDYLKAMRHPTEE